jgi:hypothetical protein
MLKDKTSPPEFFWEKSGNRIIYVPVQYAVENTDMFVIFMYYFYSISVPFIEDIQHVLKGFLLFFCSLKCKPGPGNYNFKTELEEQNIQPIPTVKICP